MAHYEENLFLVWELQRCIICLGCSNQLISQISLYFVLCTVLQTP